MPNGLHWTKKPQTQTEIPGTHKVYKTRHNNPQSAYAQHILNKRHEYGTINNTMYLLKQINKTSMLLPYEQVYIQTHQHHKQLISEQNTGEHNPIYQLIHDTFLTSLPTRPTDQYEPATE